MQLPLWVSTVLCDPSLCSRALEQRLQASTKIKSQATGGEKGEDSVGADCSEEESDEPTRSNSGIYSSALLTWNGGAPSSGEGHKNHPGRLKLSSAAPGRKPWGKGSLVKVEG